MNTQNTNIEQYNDTVTQDFKNSVIIVSLVANLTIFVTWLVTSV